MKVPKPKSKKKIIIALCSAIALVLLALGGMYLAHSGPFADNSKTKTDNSNAPASTSKSSDTTTSNSKTPVNNQPSGDATTDNEVTASITYKQQTASLLRIGVNIGEITSTGSCSLTMTKDGSNYSTSVDIQALASSSTCKGFDVPLSQLSSGTWNISIDISVGSKTGHITDQVKVE